MATPSSPWQKSSVFKWRAGRPDSAVARLWTANLAETAPRPAQDRPTTACSTRTRGRPCATRTPVRRWARRSAVHFTTTRVAPGAGGSSTNRSCIWARTSSYPTSPVGGGSGCLSFPTGRIGLVASVGSGRVDQPQGGSRRPRVEPPAPRSMASTTRRVNDRSVSRFAHPIPRSEKQRRPPSLSPRRP